MNANAEPLVISSADDGIVDVRLNRPEKLNALNRPMVEAIVAAVSDPAVQNASAVVLGANGRSFCAGADLKEGMAPETGSLSELRGRHEELQAITRALGSATGVVISSVSGFAVGGGAEIALSADLVVMHPAAKMRFPEVEIGFAPTGGITYRLPLMVGLQRAKELLLTSRWIDAEEALAIGLACAVDEDPDARALAIAEKVASSPSRAVKSVKRAIETNSLRGQERAMQAEVDAASWLFQDPEAAQTGQRYQEIGSPS